MGETVITGSAFVRAAAEKVRVRHVTLPDVRVFRHDRMRAMVTRAAAGGAIHAAVFYPLDTAALRAAVDAASGGLIVPILIGPASRVQMVAKDADLDMRA
jgi:phosphate acetyltransferase